VRLLNILPEERQEGGEQGTAGELQSPTAEGFRLVVGEVQGGEERSEEG